MRRLIILGGVAAGAVALGLVEFSVSVSRAVREAWQEGR